jgi:erythritol transport system permease protein
MSTPNNRLGNRIQAMREKGIGQILIDGRAFIALLLIIAIFASLSPNYLTVDNLLIMTKHVAINALLALGMLMVILKGGIDLSVGSIVALSGVVAGFLIRGVPIPGTDVVAYPPLWAVVIAALTVGSLVGWLNGFLITKLRVAPFIATLGMLYVARGAALLIADGKTFPKLQGDPALGNTGFRVLGQDSFLGVAPGVWFMILMAILASLLLTRTAFGRRLYAVGGNERAAGLAGVPVDRIKRATYIISGFCSALVGIVLASELTAATPQTGETFELNAIAAVVIGGAALSGGRGNVRGTILGAFVIGFLADGLVIVGVSEFWKMVIKGTVIILAVAIDQAQQKTKVTKKKDLDKPKKFGSAFKNDSPNENS